MPTHPRKEVYIIDENRVMACALHQPSTNEVNHDGSPKQVISPRDPDTWAGMCASQRRQKLGRCQKIQMVSLPSMMTSRFPFAVVSQPKLIKRCFFVANIRAARSARIVTVLWDNP